MRRQHKGLTLIVKWVPGGDVPDAGGPWYVVNILAGPQRQMGQLRPRIYFARESVSTPGWIAQLWEMGRAGCPTPILLDFCRDHGFVDRQPMPEDVLC